MKGGEQLSIAGVKGKDLQEMKVEQGSGAQSNRALYAMVSRGLFLLQRMEKPRKGLSRGFVSPSCCHGNRSK